MVITVPLSEIPKKWREDIPKDTPPNIFVRVSLELPPTPDPEIEAEKKSGKLKNFNSVDSFLADLDS